MKTSRRFILRGIGGAALALPWLEGLTPRAKAQDAAQAPFVIFFRQGNGVAQESNGELERFWPTALGALTNETMTGLACEPLIAHRSKLLFVRGTVQGGTDIGNVGCGHARGGLACLTARGPTLATVGAGENGLANGESLDHRIGRELNPGGRDSLALQAKSPSDYLDYVLTYRSAGVRRSPTTDPWVAYQTVVGDGEAMTDEALVLLTKRRKSVNDLVREEMTALLANPRLSGNDRRRLDLHLTNIRDLEISLSCGFDQPTADRIQADGANPTAGDGDTVVRVTKLHMDIATIAVACGYTRSVAIQIGNGNDQTRYRINGTTYERFHWISHRIQSDGPSGTAIAGADVMHHEIDKLHAEIFAHLVGNLAAYELPGGKTLLDHGAAVWTNDVGTAVLHSADKLPWVIAGSLNGHLKQGAYVDAGDVTHNRLLNTLGAGVGLKNGAGDPLDDFGDPTLTKGEIAAMRP